MRHLNKITPDDIKFMELCWVPLSNPITCKKQAHKEQIFPINYNELPWVDDNYKEFDLDPPFINTR